jgi:hypothetical protein
MKIAQALTTVEILKMFTRIPMPPGQVCLYKVLYEARTSLTLKQVAEAMRESNEESLKQVLSALATRIDGHGRASWDVVINKIIRVMSGGGTIELRIRPELRDAIESCPELREIIIKMTVDEIYARYGRFPGDESKYLKLTCRRALED